MNPSNDRKALSDHPVHAAAERMARAAGGVASALEPSLFRRLAGGLSADRVRATVAAALEEANLVRRTALRSAAQALEEAAAAEASDPRAAGSARALAGLCERAAAAVDRWREAAHEHQDNLIGSDERLLAACKRVRSLPRDLRP